jgi:hypothetical protein
MTRLVALLPLLVACNSGPLQWTDASTWRSRDAYLDCGGTTRPAPELFCLELSAMLLSAPARIVPATAPTVAVGTCSATVDTRTGAVTGDACTLQVTHRGRPYAVTVRPTQARLGTDGDSMTIETTWSLDAPASDVNAMPASGTIRSATYYTPVG